MADGSEETCSRLSFLEVIGSDQKWRWELIWIPAKLLVPAKEVIQHEKLAEWMREHKATVTHLTPAMGRPNDCTVETFHLLTRSPSPGQILVGGASAKFPSLKNAFLVGDQLTKRDCRLIQGLAPNCRIVWPTPLTFAHYSV